MKPKSSFGTAVTFYEDDYKAAVGIVAFLKAIVKSNFQTPKSIENSKKKIVTK